MLILAIYLIEPLIKLLLAVPLARGNANVTMLDLILLLLRVINPYLLARQLRLFYTKLRSNELLALLVGVFLVVITLQHLYYPAKLLLINQSNLVALVNELVIGQDNSLFSNYSQNLTRSLLTRQQRIASFRQQQHLCLTPLPPLLLLLLQSPCKGLIKSLLRCLRKSLYQLRGGEGIQWQRQ